MLERSCNDLDWHEIKGKTEKVSSFIATEVHTTGNLHHKQRPDENLQEYIQNVTDLTERQWELTMLVSLT